MTSTRKPRIRPNSSDELNPPQQGVPVRAPRLLDRRDHLEERRVHQDPVVEDDERAEHHHEGARPQDHGEQARGQVLERADLGQRAS